MAGIFDIIEPLSQQYLHNVNLLNGKNQVADNTGKRKNQRLTLSQTCCLLASCYFY